jgi:hypothetical protein
MPAALVPLTPWLAGWQCAICLRVRDCGYAVIHNAVIIHLEAILTSAFRLIFVEINPNSPPEQSSAFSASSEGARVHISRTALNEITASARKRSCAFDSRAMRREEEH